MGGTRLPDPARSDLAARLKKSFDTGARHVHKLMKVQDTKEGWKALAATLDEPAYRDWGRLLHLLARLQDPSAPDPVSELSKFLADLDTRKFELDFRDGLSLSIPLDLTAGLDRVEAVGPLAITVAHGQELKTFKFAVQKGEPRGSATVYQLTPESPGRIAYYPGDDLRAELRCEPARRSWRAAVGDRSLDHVPLRPPHPRTAPHAPHRRYRTRHRCEAHANGRERDPAVSRANAGEVADVARVPLQPARLLLSRLTE